MKYILIAIAALTLAACNDERATVESDSGRNYRVECIDGIEYLVRSSLVYKGFMAVRVDPETLTFVRCERD
jgi:hypothetical protein